MKSTPVMIFVFAAALLFGGCSENEPGPEQEEENQLFKDVNDIAASSEITPYGGEVEATDGSGNVISFTFPPGAIRDTTEVTLTIIGKYSALPIDERQVHIFKIEPSDLRLYRPATVTIEYGSAVDEIQQPAIFRLRSEELLVPLADHAYPSGNTTVSATTVILGEFAEGKMSIEQVNAQLDLLFSSMGITWKSAGIPVQATESRSSGCEQYKDKWDEGMELAAGVLKLFEWRELAGWYSQEPGRGSLDEDVNKVCSNIIEPAINDVMKLGEPADPCCEDYAHTMEAMMQAATGCGTGGSTLDQLNNQYNNVHAQCHTYLDITTEVNIESGGLLIMNTGEVMLSLAGIGDGEASVTGTGEITVTGSGNAGGECSATIAGQTFVSVVGIRDAAYVYTLTVQMDQYAMMTTVCPKIVVESPLTGSSSREITLGPGNSFSISETEMIDEGTATVQASLNNPYVPVKDPE
jgi:hypothetical protein